jgi:hypothetical protein
MRIKCIDGKYYIVASNNEAQILDGPFNNKFDAMMELVEASYWSTSH